MAVDFFMFVLTFRWATDVLFCISFIFYQLETTKFLYGCAVNAHILKVNWVTDLVAAGSALPPNKYVFCLFFIHTLAGGIL